MTMNLVDELQVSAEQDDVLTVLRKTKRLASKLGRTDITDWLKSEVDGYPKGSKVPDYRMVMARLAYNTNGQLPSGWGMLKNGIEPVGDGAFNMRLPFPEAISNIIQLSDGNKLGRGIYQPLPNDMPIVQSIRARFHPVYARQISFLCEFNAPSVKAIPEQIKDTVLDWALALEVAGVFGENMTFNATERQTAQNITFNIHDSTVEQLNNMGTNQTDRRHRRG